MDIKKICFKNYILKHKNIDVCELVIDDSAHIIAIGSIFNVAHIPYGCMDKNKVNKKALNYWLTNRSIPLDRDGVEKLFLNNSFKSPQELVLKNYALSLSDHYWLCPLNAKIKWETINYFDNNFSDELGSYLLGISTLLNSKNFNTPDITSDGVLKKKWTIFNNNRYLIKGSTTLGQEPYNEVLASIICKKLGISYVEYKITEIDKKIYSICPNFLTKDTELVPAIYVHNASPKLNDVSDYQHFINQCVVNGISDAKLKVNQMIVLDYIIANEDRHYNNFGIIRDANTLKWISVAPIYDSGTSMFAKSKTISMKTSIPCKTFRSDHEKQIQLIDDFSWLDLSQLDGIENDYKNLLQMEFYNDQNRIDKLCLLLRARIKNLTQFIASKK